MLDKNERDTLLLRSKYVKQRNYWQETLEGEFESTAFREAGVSHGTVGEAAASVALSFSAALSQRLIALGKGSDLSLYIILLSALKALIFRYRGNPDVITLSPINNQIDTRGAMNSLVFVRDQLNGELSFKELILTLRQSVIRAYENQDYPYDKLLEFLYPDSGADNIAALSTVYCSLTPLHQVPPEDARKAAVRFFFTAAPHEDGHRLEGRLEYRQGEFGETDMQRLAGHYTGLLEDALRDVNTKLSALSFLTPAEEEQLLITFNNNIADFSHDKSICHLFADHARKNPTADALLFHDEAVSYRTLDRQSDLLALHIKEKGVSQDATVGVLMERSPQMVRSILAVWKAGGAYIPLDTQYPMERIAEILGDSGSKMLIAEPQYVTEELSAHFDGQIIPPHLQPMETQSADAVDSLDSTEYADGAGSVDNPDWLEGFNMHSLAYVIYTSGSTGKPKGAMVEHIGMMNHIAAKVNDLQLTSRCIVAQNSSHTFDISVWQFFVALTRGGKTVIYPGETVLEPQTFIQRVVRDNITILEVVPSYLSVMLEILNRRFTPFPSLDYLLVTGETVKPALVKRWFELFPRIPMVNAYGPTEASDDITHHVMTRAPDCDRIPIGKNIQNLNIYVVDKFMNLCPIGVKGEILVSGVGVGRGYLNDETRTREVFTLDPFCKGDGDNPLRLYKTGDLGLRMEDGTIDFFGRKDYQVKIGGFRIELGEIENRLADFPPVKEAAVIVKEAAEAGTADGQDDKFLCAFVVLDGDMDRSAMKAFLSDKLPFYMVPEHIVALPRLPLTPNGKIDRKALDKMELNLASGQEYVAPRNDVEKYLAALFGEILGTPADKIGIDNDFFDEGGHSLKATMLVSRIHKEMEVKVTVAQLFQNATVRALAQIIEEAEKEKYNAINPVEKKEYYPLSSVQNRMYVAQQMKAEGTAYNMPTFVPLASGVDMEVLSGVFNRLIQRHEAFRSSFITLDNIPVQKIDDTVPFSFEHYEGDTLRDVLTDFMRPFELSRAPLMRAGILKLTSGNALLMVDMHHIITDAVSQTVLAQDFTALYNGETLAPLRLQYKDYAQWQQRLHDTGKMDEQKEYWLDVFKYSRDAPEVNIPMDYPRPRVRDIMQGDNHVFHLDGELSNAVEETANRTDTTVYMVLLAVYYIFLAKYTRREDIVVGALFSGRSHPDLLSVIGAFVNTLPMRNFPAKEKRFETFLREVKENALNAAENQDFPLEQLVSLLDRQGEAGRNPLFDTVFTLDTGSIIPRAQDKHRALMNMENTPKTETPTDSTAGDGGKGSSARLKFAKFDLYFMVIPKDRHIDMLIRYSTQLFKPSTIETLGRYYTETLRQVMADTTVSIKDITFSHQFVTGKSTRADEDDGDFVF